jgi:ABC-type ATPase with predicted acetyltransferase domain
MTIQEMNKQLSIINRVVIHPKYRTIGLGAMLIRDTLLLTCTQYVEMIAVMAKYSPFAEKGGMKKIIEQQSVTSVSEILKTLSGLGFDLQLLCSERYIENKLERLNSEQIGELKFVIIKSQHPRFKKEFTVGRHQPFGKTIKYSENIQNMNKFKLAKIIKLVGVISQTKVYLFWRRDFTSTS